MKLRTLPLHIRQRLLQYQEDTLTPECEKQNSFFEKPCPRCGGALHRRLAERPFHTTSVVPRLYAQCVDCGCELDTQTGLMVTMGNPAKVEEPFPIIKPKED